MGKIIRKDLLVPAKIISNPIINSEFLLENVETEFRNQYWSIRNGRRTNWKAVNRTRVLAECLYLLGVPVWAVKEARYCLRMVVCQRCVNSDVRCWSFSGRAKRGDFQTNVYVR